MSPSSIIAALCLAALSAPAHAICAGGQSLDPLSGKKIVLADDVLFFKTDVIKLDIDGSPFAYGVKDQGTENICNGLGPLTPSECKGKASAQCTPFCQLAFRQWHDSGAKLEKLGSFMCSIGLGGANCSAPAARLQAPPRTDWFVSESSVKLAPPQGTALADWLPTQGAQIDSMTVPYFVITQKIRKLPWDATPGDLGVVVPNDGGPAVAFMIGDTGGRLDEGSARLLALLRGVDALPTVAKTSALGEPVQRLVGEKSGDFRIAIFRHSGVVLPGDSPTKIVNKSASELPGWVRDEAATRLAAIGGVDRVIACTTP